MLNPFRIKSKLELKNTNSDAYKSTVQNDTLTADSTVTLPNFATNTLASANNAQTFTATQTFPAVNVINSAMFISTNTTLGAISLTYFVDTTAGAINVTLPAIAAGLRIVIKDAKDTWGTNNCVIIPSTGDKIDGYAANDTLAMDISGAWIELQANASNERWVITTSTTPNQVATLTASKVLISDASGFIAASSVASTNLPSLGAANVWAAAQTFGVLTASTSATSPIFYAGLGSRLSIVGDSNSTYVQQNSTGTTGGNYVESKSASRIQLTGTVAGGVISFQHSVVGTAGNAITWIEGGKSTDGVWANIAGGSWGTISDVRLKKEIVTLNNGLRTILSLHPVSYKWRDENVSSLRPTEHFIADEVELINPKWVTISGKEKITENGVESVIENCKQVNLDASFNAYLVAAIQELNAKIEAQQVEINSLKGAIK